MTVCDRQPQTLNDSPNFRVPRKCKGSWDALGLNVLRNRKKKRQKRIHILEERFVFSLYEEQIIQGYSYTHRAYGPGDSGIITNCFQSKPPAGERVLCSMEIAGYYMILIQIPSMIETFSVPLHYLQVTNATVQYGCMQRISTS